METKRDFRTLYNNTQAELRRLALSQVHKGRDLQNIADLMEVNIQTLWMWIRNEKELLDRNFQGLLRGRKEGEKRTLKPDQETLIKDIILEKVPEDVGLGAALWTRRRIQELIEKKTKLFLPINTVGNQLVRWGLTSQRPGKVAYQQDILKIENWIKMITLK